MYATHTLAEWFAFLLLGVGAHGALSVPYFLTVDADLCDFDPRPAVRCATKAVHLRAVYAASDLAWAAASVRHELVPAAACVRHAAYGGRELARDAAALAVLLTTTPKGQLR
mgnify:CR=1 FL=1